LKRIRSMPREEVVNIQGNPGNLKVRKPGAKIGDQRILNGRIAKVPSRIRS